MSQPCIFVVEDDVRLKNPWPVLTEKEKRIRDDLKHDLEKISLMKGRFGVSAEAYDFFSHWYNTENVKIEDARFSGYAERKHIHVLKVAMLLSACESSEGVIEARHLRSSLNLLGRIEAKMVRAFGGTGRSELAADIDEILNTIIDAGTISRTDLMRSVKMNVHPKDLDTIIGMLEVTGDIVKVVKNGSMFYSFVKDKPSHTSPESP